MRIFICSENALFDVNFIDPSTHAVLAFVLLSGRRQKTFQKLYGSQNCLRTNVTNVILVEVNNRYRWLCGHQLIAVAVLLLFLRIQSFHIRVSSCI